MCSINSHGEVWCRTEHHVHPQQNMRHSGVSELVFPAAQQTPQQLLQEPECKGRQGDQYRGIGDGQGLPLAPHGQYDIGELVEEGQQSVQAVGREEVNQVLGLLMVPLGTWGVTE